MNQVILCGRTTKDIELQTTNNGKNYCRFQLAVNRRFKDQNGENVTDFHNIICWNKTAEICSKYVKKGREILVRGELQNRSYDAQDGTKRYVSEIIVDEVNLIGGRIQNTSEDYGEPTPPPERGQTQNSNEDELTPIENESLPF